MTTPELNFRDLAGHLPPAATVAPIDLWPQIASVYQQHRRRRQLRRLGGAGLALVAGLVAVALVPGLRPGDTAAIDWQARAQALELQLNAAPLAAASASIQNDAMSDTETELARTDATLQSLYDHGANKSELVPLWKQRSDLLSTLLVSRRQQLTLTRI